MEQFELDVNLGLNTKLGHLLQAVEQDTENGRLMMILDDKKEEPYFGVFIVMREDIEKMKKFYEGM